jgi:hypothetical protein
VALVIAAVTWGVFPSALYASGRRSATCMSMQTYGLGEALDQMILRNAYILDSIEDSVKGLVAVGVVSILQ